MFPKLPKLKISHVLRQGVEKEELKPNEYGEHAPGSFCQKNQFYPVYSLIVQPIPSGWFRGQETRDRSNQSAETPVATSRLMRIRQRLRSTFFARDATVSRVFNNELYYNGTRSGPEKPSRNPGLRSESAGAGNGQELIPP
ncbi:hypothetical protein J6590_001541 [Homalodisca vitripennis]|nr:hypothetical protein J6590_001541 [Homalodisca vitripennis]